MLHDRAVYRDICAGLITLDNYTILDVVQGLRTIYREFALISQRQSGNLGFQTFYAEQWRSAK